MLSSKRFVWHTSENHAQSNQCHLDTSRRSSIFPCSCVWMTAITFLKARLHDTQIRSRTFSNSQLNKFLCFQTCRIDTHQNITQATALLALKAEITAKCMASEGSNCSFSSFEGRKQGLRHNHGSNRVSCSHLQKEFPRNLYMLHFAPNRTLHVRPL